jgi:hypothetical protein
MVACIGGIDLVACAGRNLADRGGGKRRAGIGFMKARSVTEVTERMTGLPHYACQEIWGDQL